MARLATVLVDLARELDGLDEADEADVAARHVVGTAVSHLAADDGGVSLGVGGRTLRVLGATSERTAHVAGVERELDEGPCLESLRTGVPVLVGDVARDRRWPTWSARAARAGVRSLVSAPLTADARLAGTLVVLGDRPSQFGDVQAEDLLCIAEKAGTWLAAHEDARHLRSALASRSTIAQAQGLVMAEFDLDADEAFAYLKRLSQDNNVRVRDLAQLLVDHRGAVALVEQLARSPRRTGVPPA